MSQQKFLCPHHFGKRFPVIYEDDRIRIYKDPEENRTVIQQVVPGEDVPRGVRISLLNDTTTGLEFEASGQPEAVLVGNNRIGWHIGKRR